MKFLLSKDLHANANYILLLSFYTIMMLLYFIGDIFYMGNFFGTSFEEVLSTLKGNPDEFLEPLSLLSLLEHFHISLFLAILALFTTMAILLRINLMFVHKKIIIILSMGTLLLSFLCLFGTYFVHDIFVYGFVTLSLAWHITGIYSLILILKQVWFK